MSTVETRTVAARLPVEQADALEALARESGRTVTDVLRGLVGRTLTAHARKTDPATSRAAARSVVNVTAKHRAVLSVMRGIGYALTDAQIAREYVTCRMRDPERFPRQAPSGLRTRRAELVDLGMVEAHGKGILPSGRDAITWAVVA